MTKASNLRPQTGIPEGLITQAAWPAMIVAAVAAVGPLLASLATEPLVGAFKVTALLIASASGLATIALSAIVLFDALLFRLIDSHDTEPTGTAAVDNLLVRMGLRSAPVRNRSLAERMAGTSRLLVKQRLMLGVFIVATAVVAIWAQTPA